MILVLDSEHRIFGGEHAWELQRPRVSKGKTEWRPYKWLPSLADALRQAAHDEIRTAPCEGVVESLKAVERITQRYASLIDGASAEIAARVRQ